MIDAAVWIEVMAVKILLRELRGKLFLLGEFEFADLPALREAGILYTYRFDRADCPRASRALGFIGGDPLGEGDFGAFGKWAGN